MAKEWTPEECLDLTRPCEGLVQMLVQVRMGVGGRALRGEGAWRVVSVAERAAPPVRRPGAQVTSARSVQTPTASSFWSSRSARWKARRGSCTT